MGNTVEHTETHTHRRHSRTQGIHPDTLKHKQHNIGDMDNTIKHNTMPNTMKHLKQSKYRTHENIGGHRNIVECTETHKTQHNT